MNRMIFLSACILSSTLAFAAAQDNAAPYIAAPNFDALDADHDAKVSAEEAAGDVNVAAAFQDLDTDQDGYLMRDEFDQLLGQATSSPPHGAAETETDPAPGGATSAEEATAAAPQQLEPSAEPQPLAEEFVGKPLVGPDGESVGDIEEVAYDAVSGEEVAVVQVGGFLGFFGKDVAIPLAELRVRPDGAVHTAMSEDELERLPEFAPDEKG